MSDPLEYLARRAAEKPFYLGATLALFTESQPMNDEELCRFLHCPAEQLPLLRLCRTPDEEAPGFQQDVKRIAERFGVDVNALAKAVRRGQALRKLRQGAEGGTLLAARDNEEEPQP